MGTGFSSLRPFRLIWPVLPLTPDPSPRGEGKAVGRFSSLPLHLEPALRMEQHAHPQRP